MELAAQLASLKFKVNTRGQIQIESKEDMKKRGLPSPDKADTLAPAFGRLKHAVAFTALDVPIAGPPVPAQATVDLTDAEQPKQADLEADLAIMRADRR